MTVEVIIVLDTPSHQSSSRSSQDDDPPSDLEEGGAESAINDDEPVREDLNEAEGRILLCRLQ